MQKRGRRRPGKRPSIPFFGQKHDARERTGLSFRRRRKKLTIHKARPVLILVVQLVAVVWLAYFTVTSFGMKQTVAGASMEPTLTDGDEVLLNRFSYHISSPKPGDLIAFYPGGSRSANISIKRVIATPGDTVRIANGALYVNDILYEDVTKTDYIYEAGVAAEGVTLGDNEYFVLGDNRNNSEDSRYPTIGNIARDTIVGKAWLDVTRDNFGWID